MASLLFFRIFALGVNILYLELLLGVLRLLLHPSSFFFFLPKFNKNGSGFLICFFYSFSLVVFDHLFPCYRFFYFFFIGEDN